jgi:hypothetical protein
MMTAVVASVLALRISKKLLTGERATLRRRRMRDDSGASADLQLPSDSEAESSIAPLQEESAEMPPVSGSSLERAVAHVLRQIRSGARRMLSGAKSVVIWCADVFWFLIPIQRTPALPRSAGHEHGVRPSDASGRRRYVPRWSWKRTLMTAARSAAWGLSKVCLVPLVYSASLALSSSPSSSSLSSRAALYACFGASVLLSSWPMDFLNSAIVTLSRGRYQLLTLNDFPLFSTSLSDFWSHRYNRLMRVVYHDSVLDPLRSAGVGADAAALAVFAVSGALHAYVAQLTFGHGALSAFSFFIAHGCAVTADRAMARHAPKVWHGALRAAFAPLALIVTAPLYGGLFVDAMPRMLLNSPPLRVPFFSTYFESLFGVTSVSAPAAAAATAALGAHVAR